MGIEPTAFSAVNTASSGERIEFLSALAQDPDLAALVERLVEIWPRLAANAPTNKGHCGDHRKVMVRHS